MDKSYNEYLDNKYDGYSKSEYDEKEYERKYNKEYDGDIKSKHVPSKYDEEFDKEYAEDLKYEEYEKNKNKNNDNDDNDDNDKNDDNDNVDYFVESIHNDNYGDLLGIAEHREDKNKNKITNVIIALIKLFKISDCNETSFKYDFTFGPLSEWMETAKLYNDNYSSDIYRILIDENSIVCSKLQN
jgi:hypothetical protein